MNVAEMFGQSLIVTLLGISVVFGFLVILIIAITLSGNIIHALGLDKDLQAPVKAKVSPPAPVLSAGTGNNAAVAAAISAAVAEYRKIHS